MRRFARLLTVILIGLALTACSKPHTHLERVKAAGVLHVLTRKSITTYYEGPMGPTGLEYDLSKRFADYLGVKLKLTTPANFGDILKDIRQGKGDLAAAGITVTPEREKTIHFGLPYEYITQQLIYRVGTPRPRTIDDLTNGQLEVVANSSHAERLRQLRRTHPRLTWTANPNLGPEELLSLVRERVIDYTIVDSNDAALNRRFYPELRVAFNLTPPQPLAWAFPRDGDNSLYQAAVAFFRQLKASGELNVLLDRYYGHVEDYDYAGTTTYMRQIHLRLPDYQAAFKKAATTFNLDWRLLAAMAYQESHWNPAAVSPTGVRGLMMLTLATARHLGIKKRTDPLQSIRGGARYLHTLMAQIPPAIKEPDRTWFALAAYNVGLGHLEDARILTQRRGGNPDKWADVKQNLPLLRQRKWYRTSRHGYARGDEAVRYVENIRSYYDILSWILKHKGNYAQQQPIQALLINSPLL